MEDTRNLVAVSKALSDINRIYILKLLQSSPLCVCELTELLESTQSTVSKHLKVLVDNQLVDSEKQGQWIVYRLSNGSENAIVANLMGNLKFWGEMDESVIRLKQHLPHVIRNSKRTTTNS